MAVIFAFGEPVTVKSPGTKTDPYSGAETEDWSPAAVSTRVVPLCAIYPRMSEEPLEVGRTAVISGYTIILPPGDPITRRDRVSFRNVTDREVDGDPFDYLHPMTGWRPGVVANTKGVDG